MTDCFELNLEIVRKSYFKKAERTVVKTEDHVT